MSEYIEELRNSTDRQLQIYACELMSSLIEAHHIKESGHSVEQGHKEIREKLLRLLKSIKQKVK